MKQAQELPGIEVLRFVCAFGVLIWHYQHFFFMGEWDPTVGQAIRPTFPFYHFLRFFYDNGSLAVPFFWVISGFIFFWHYSESIRDRSVRFREFLLRRFARLYPLHFLTLIIVALGQYVYRGSHQTAFIYIWNKPIWFGSQLLFASNWFDRQPESFNGPIWSVSIEILIYVFFFLVARTFRQHAWSSALIAGGFAICLILPHTFMNREVFACGMYFFAGGAAQRLTVNRHVLTVAGCVLAAIVTAISIGVCNMDVAAVLLLASTAVIVLSRLGDSVVGAPLRLMAFLGNTTYASYLLHFPLQLGLVIAVDAAGLSRDIFLSPVIFLGFLTLVIGLSLLVHRYFEKPAQLAIRAGLKSYPGKIMV